MAFARSFGQPTIGHVKMGHVRGHPEVYSAGKNRAVNKQPSTANSQQDRNVHGQVRIYQHKYHSLSQPAVRLAPPGNDRE